METTSDRRGGTASRRVLRGAAVGLASGRAALGVVAIATPARLARPWVGDDGGRPAAHVLGRALGARDLVLGLGALRALAVPDEPVRPWIVAGGLADAVDAAATFRAWSSLPARGRWAVAGVAVSAAALSALAGSRPPG